VPIHNFTSKDDVKDGIIPPQIPGHPDLRRDPDFIEDPTNTTVDQDIRSILPVGFATMDRGIKHYFSGALPGAPPAIRIPTKDGMKELTVRLAGGDKTILIYKQDLQFI